MWPGRGTFHVSAWINLYVIDGVCYATNTLRSISELSWPKETRRDPWPWPAKTYSLFIKILVQGSAHQHCSPAGLLVCEHSITGTHLTADHLRLPPCYRRRDESLQPEGLADWCLFLGRYRKSLLTPVSCSAVS